MIQVRIAISGRNYAAAESVPEQLELADGSTVDDALSALSEFFPAEAGLPDTCLVALSGAHLGTLAKHTARELRDNDELVLIAPVAGG